MSDFSSILPQVKGNDVYMYLSKDNPDWANDSGVELVLHFDGKKVSLPLDDTESLCYLVSALHHFVDKRSLVVAWGAKDIFSFLKGRTEISLELHSQIYDISLISSYFSLPMERPGTFKDAMGVLKRASRINSWKHFMSLYGKVYAPLFSVILPEIETGCLVDNFRKICVYPHYVLEGQVNGRLKALKLNSSSYNPHSLGEKERLSLKPRNYDETFVYFDYRNMEVNVLQWLSGDEELAGMLVEGDVYKAIWRRITRQEPSESQRSLCKNLFLPVVFGQGKASLSKKMGISEEIATKLIHSLNRTFPVAFDWVKSQSPDGNNVATDALGRRRKFEGHDLYKIKNFCIQSPASMICLRKLVRLHEALSGMASICFHVHDGYCVLCKNSDLDLVREAGVSALEEEDCLFEGLSLSTTCKFGPNLNELEEIILTKEIA